MFAVLSLVTLGYHTMARTLWTCLFLSLTAELSVIVHFMLQLLGHGALSRLSVRLSSSLNVFRRCLKTELFRQSYPF